MKRILLAQRSSALYLTLFVALALGMFAPSNTIAQGPPHDATSNIDCLDCHAGRGPVRRVTVTYGEDQETLCKMCHNPTGIAAGTSDVISHMVGANTMIDCASCHDPHGPSAPDPLYPDEYNLNLIRSNTAKYLPGAVEPAIFQDDPLDPGDLKTYVFETAPFSGVCQTCHQNTTHWRNDSLEDPHHNLGANCISCHEHSNGFRASGCTSCHSEQQPLLSPILRPVVANEDTEDEPGDFEKGSHHVRGTVEDNDCQVCHYTRNHTSGTVKLLDPDLGNALVYEYDPANPEGVEGFCLACHDADGALAFDTPLQPFSDGVTPPDVVGAAGSLWADSAHNTITPDEYVGNPPTCLGDGLTTGCHGNAHGTGNVKLLSEAAGAATVDALCFNCHTDGKITNDSLSAHRGPGYAQAANDIEESFGRAQRHDMGTAFSVGGNSFEFECSSCHNPHVVTGKYWEAEDGYSPVTRPDFSDPVNNPRAMGTTLWGVEPGEKMDDYAAQGTGTGGYSYSTARGDEIIFDQPAQYRPPKSGDGHKSEYTGDVLPDYTTLCLDCHTSQMSAESLPINWANTPHGLTSANQPAYMSDTGTAGAWGNSGNPDVLFDMNYVTRGRGAGHFMRWPYDSADRNAGVNFVMSCTDCHEAHGSNRGGMVRERYNVNAYGACGSGSLDGDSCADGSLWNSFCNSCHYYYGGHHAGMSCGTASCHLTNSPHKMDRKGGGGGTRLQLTATGWQDSYVKPDFTPDILLVVGHIGSEFLTVTFRQIPESIGIYSDVDHDTSTFSGALDVNDFWFFDQNTSGQFIVGVTHVAGDFTATIELNTALQAGDLDTDTLAARSKSIWAWYDGGYVNAATGILGSEAVPAGPWPVAVTGPPPFNLQGVLYGRTERKLNGIVIDSNQIHVTFTGEAYSPGGGDLQIGDFTLACGGRSISSVTHTAGATVAILTLNTTIDQSEVGICTVAAVEDSIVDEYDSPADPTAIALALPPEASVDDMVLRWDFNEGAGSVTASTGALGTQEDMHGVLTRNVQWVASASSGKPGAAAGDNAVLMDRVSDRGAVQLNYPINPDDGFPPATYSTGGAPVIVQEMQPTEEFTFAIWIKPTALGCQEGKDLGLNNALRRDILSTQFWIKNWAVGIMRFSDDGNPISGTCTAEDSTHDALRFWVAVGDPDDMRCDSWGGSWPERVHPVSPAGYIQGASLAPTDQATCDTSATPTLPTNTQGHAFAQTETTASGAPEYGVALQTDVWQHVAGTWDGRYIRIYIDGQLAAETDMGGTGNYVVHTDPHLWGGDMLGDGSLSRHVSSFFNVGARGVFSGSGSPSAGATYWTTNGFYDLNVATFVGELDDVKFWKIALPQATIED